MNVSLSTGTSSSLGQYDIVMQDTSGILLSHQAQDPSLTGNNSVLYRIRIYIYEKKTKTVTCFVYYYWLLFGEKNSNKIAFQ